jgi:hypothetical protein
MCKSSDLYKMCETCKSCDALKRSGDGGEEKRNWQQRLSLLRVSVPGLFKRLGGEIPRVETP